MPSIERPHKRVAVRMEVNHKPYFILVLIQKVLNCLGFWFAKRFLAGLKFKARITLTFVLLVELPISFIVAVEIYSKTLSIALFNSSWIHVLPLIDNFCFRRILFMCLLNHGDSIRIDNRNEVVLVLCKHILRFFVSVFNSSLD